MPRSRSYNNDEPHYDHNDNHCKPNDKRSLLFLIQSTIRFSWPGILISSTNGTVSIIRQPCSATGTHFHSNSSVSPCQCRLKGLSTVNAISSAQGAVAALRPMARATKGRFIRLCSPSSPLWPFIPGSGVFISSS